jgi:hypothetical protein
MRAAAVAALTSAIIMPPAHAVPGAPAAGQLYYININGTEIMRVPVTGGTPAPVVSTGSGTVTAMAIADGRLFWAAATSSGASADYITLDDPARVHTLITGLSFPGGLVTAGGWLYYMDQDAIGRVRFNGSGLSRRFIRLPQQDSGGLPTDLALATDGSHLYFSGCQDAIGRVSLSGTGLDPAFIKLPGFSCQLSLAVGNTHIYWAEADGYLGRATLTGRDASDAWLNTGSETPFLSNVAADGTSVYWDWGYLTVSGGFVAYVGTASVSGTGVRTQFLTGQGPFVLTAPGSSS